MKKYWRVVKNQWDEIFTYRLNFIMWRVRNVLQLLGGYFLWLAILTQDGQVLGYSSSVLLSYIFGVYILQSFIFATRTQTIGVEITQGDLVNYLIRPVNYFSFYVARDLGDKFMNFFFSIGEFLLFYILLQPPLFLQNDIRYLILFLLSIILASILYFLFSVLLSFIGFWSQDIWAPRFIFSIVIGFFAGGFFPLDMLPKYLFAIFQAMPFQYLLYFPMKIYLGQLSFGDIGLGFLLCVFWIGVFSFITKIIWERGLRVYSAYGR